LFHRNDEGMKMTRKHSNKTNKSGSAQKTVKDIRRATRRNYGVEEKIRIVLEGLRGEHTRGRPYHPQTQGKIER